MASELADRLKRDGRLPLGSRGAAEPDPPKFGPSPPLVPRRPLRLLCPSTWTGSFPVGGAVCRAGQETGGTAQMAVPADTRLRPSTGAARFSNVRSASESWSPFSAHLADDFPELRWGR